MSALFDEWCAKHDVTPEERSALVAFLATHRAQRTLRALADAPSPPETPAPVHYLARFAAGSFIACDPTIKDGWTPDPLAVTCEECRKVIRWRCGQAPAPETPASEGTPKVAFRGSGSDLATDVAALLTTPALVAEFMAELHGKLPDSSPASAPSRGGSGEREAVHAIRDVWLSARTNDDTPPGCYLVDSEPMLHAHEVMLRALSSAPPSHDSGNREIGALTRIASLARDQRRPEAQLDRIAAVARRALSPQGDGGTEG